MHTDNARNDTKALAQKVEARYNGDFKKKFPYEDCYKLQRKSPLTTASLIPDLDAYFSFIAGYSSGATSLSERPLGELRNAVVKLKNSFFDTHPQYKPLEKLIVPTDTGTLHLDLRVADELRRDLVAIMEQTLQ